MTITNATLEDRLRQAGYGDRFEELPVEYREAPLSEASLHGSIVYLDSHSPCPEWLNLAALGIDEELISEITGVTEYLAEKYELFEDDARRVAEVHAKLEDLISGHDLPDDVFAAAFETSGMDKLHAFAQRLGELFERAADRPHSYDLSMDEVIEQIGEEVGQ
jgi:hypothetical protein